MTFSFLRFLDHTQRRTTVGRTPLDEWSARRRDICLTTLTTDKHPCPRRDSNPQSQQASGRKPTPSWTVNAVKFMELLITYFFSASYYCLVGSSSVPNRCSCTDGNR